MNQSARLSTILLNTGMPASIKGYRFIQDAVKMVIEKPETIDKITKELYPGVALKHNTTAGKVERGIRHAILYAWTKGDIEALNTAFGCQVVSKRRKPTNGEFIALIADRLSVESSIAEEKEAI
jgi:two-component system response regulator (stage 0 sporulation protein A)